MEKISAHVWTSNCKTMNEELQFILDSAKESMQGAISHLESELLNIRAGKANPVMLKSVMVDYYGAPTPLSQVANVNTPDGRTLSIQPWEKSLLTEIEKGIMIANLGFNPMNNGESIIINVPPLTEERRKELAKMAKAETENAKVSVRNARKDANQEIKKSEASEDMQKNTEIDIQTVTDGFILKIDSILAAKEKEIMTV
jgi:ribosome recycling factor